MMDGNSRSALASQLESVMSLAVDPITNLGFFANDSKIDRMETGGKIGN